MFNAPLPPNTPSPPRTPLREGPTPSSLRAEPTPPLERRAHEQRHEPFEPSPVAGRRRSSVARFFQSMRSPIEASRAAPAAPVLWSNEPTRLAQPAGAPRPWQRLRQSLRRDAPAPYRPVPASPAQTKSCAKKQTVWQLRSSDVMRAMEEFHFSDDRGGEASPLRPEKPLEESRFGRAIGPRACKTLRGIEGFVDKLITPTEQSLQRAEAEMPSARMRQQAEYERFLQAKKLP